MIVQIWISWIAHFEYFGCTEHESRKGISECVHPCVIECKHGYRDRFRKFKSECRNCHENESRNIANKFGSSNMIEENAEVNAEMRWSRRWMRSKCDSEIIVTMTARYDCRNELRNELIRTFTAEVCMEWALCLYTWIAWAGVWHAQAPRCTAPRTLQHRYYYVCLGTKGLQLACANHSRAPRTLSNTNAQL